MGCPEMNELNKYIKNKCGEPYEIVSPSGQYKVVVQPYSTEKGGWNITQGTVIRTKDGKQIAQVTRNYRFNNCSFVMKNDEEWLITGKSYMGQTIINLDREIEYNDPKHPDKYEGFEFCWANSTLSPDGNTLCVTGCHWACPYEHKFYDFTDPSKGWPELELDLSIAEREGDSYNYDYPDAEGEIEPVWIGHDKIDVYESSHIFKPLGLRDEDIDFDDDEDNLVAPDGSVIDSAQYDDEENNWIWQAHTVRTFHRVENKMTLIQVVLSPEQEERREKRRVHEKKSREQKTKWIAESAIWAEVQKQAELLGLPDPKRGWMHPSQNDIKEGKEAPGWHFRVRVENDNEENGPIGYLTWGVETGLLVVSNWVHKKGEEEKARLGRTLHNVRLALKVIEEVMYP